jgi:hypothetical protein
MNVVCAAESKLTMLVVQAKGRDDGFFLVFVPNNLTADQINDGLTEIEIEPRQVLEVGGWETATVGLAAAFLPFPAVE